MFRPTPERKGARERWIFGDIFLRAYDVIHDYKDLKLGLVGEAMTAPPDQSFLMKAPEEEVSSVGIIVGVLAFVGCGACLFGVKVCYDKK